MTTRPAPTAAVPALSPALRSAVSWVLLAVAVICGAGCAGALDQARLTPALLLTLAPVALAGLLATAALLTLNRAALHEYIDLENL